MHLINVNNWTLQQVWDLEPQFPTVLQLNAGLNEKPPGTQEHVSTNLVESDSQFLMARTCTTCIKLLQRNFQQQKLDPLVANPKRVPTGNGLNLSSSIYLNKWQLEM